MRAYDYQTQIQFKENVVYHFIQKNLSVVVHEIGTFIVLSFLY